MAYGIAAMSEAWTSSVTARQGNESINKAFSLPKQQNN